MKLRWLKVAILAVAVIWASLSIAGRASQAPAAPQAIETVRAIAKPTRPLPAEDASANITKFSFIVYGDTRGRQDGTALQYEHSMVVDSMLATIKSLDVTDAPVKFVLQSGDAVVNGGDAKQWNRSFVDLINKLTAGAGVPYFLAPGNHDVTASADLNAASRVTGLKNYIEDASGKHRMDHVVTGGGGAPLYSYQGEPATRDFIAAGKDNKVSLEHLVKPGMTAGENPYHYVVMRVDGDDIQLDVIGVDWGRGFAPYRSAKLALKDGGAR